MNLTMSSIHHLMIFLTDDEETETENDQSFYRNFDNREEFHKVKNQIIKPCR